MVLKYPPILLTELYAAYKLSWTALSVASATLYDAYKTIPSGVITGVFVGRSSSTLEDNSSFILCGHGHINR